MFIQINLDKHIRPAHKAYVKCQSAFLPPSYYRRMVAVVLQLEVLRSIPALHPSRLLMCRYSVVSFSVL